MMTTDGLVRLCLAAMLLVSGWVGAADDPEDPVTFSEAETRLWMTDQLKSIEQPVTLTYAFEKSGSLEPGFKDSVTFNVTGVNTDGSKAASLQFFTGERNFPVPPVESTTVNPILKVYLQGDVYEMNRLTDPDGSARERWRYFQRRIKFALSDGASVEPKNFVFDGKEWSGYEVVFRPYINDPRRELFEQLAGKEYRFQISDELPGYVFRIETSVPGAGESAEPLLRETLQLVSAEPRG